MSRHRDKKTLNQSLQSFIFLVLPSFLTPTSFSPLSLSLSLLFYRTYPLHRPSLFLCQVYKICPFYQLKIFWGDGNLYKKIKEKRKILTASFFSQSLAFFFLFIFFFNLFSWAKACLFLFFLVESVFYWSLAFFQFCFFLQSYFFSWAKACFISFFLGQKRFLFLFFLVESVFHWSLAFFQFLFLKSYFFSWAKACFITFSLEICL